MHDDMKPGSPYSEPAQEVIWREDRDRGVVGWLDDLGRKTKAELMKAPLELVPRYTFAACHTVLFCSHQGSNGDPYEFEFI